MIWIRVDLIAVAQVNIRCITKSQTAIHEATLNKIAPFPMPLCDGHRQHPMI